MSVLIPGHIIRVPVTIAPVEHIEGDGQFSMNGGTFYRSTPQAQRCLRCNALVAVGDSFKDHIFWCKRVPDRIYSRVPAVI